MEKISDPQPPSGMARLAFRVPIWFYHARMGWLLGGRFLMLTHKGRASGKQRYTVLEVVKHEAENHTYYVGSGYGEKADWYRNVMTNPHVIIQVGNRCYKAHAERLPPDKGAEIILDYGRRHPATLRQLAAFMGYQIENTEDDQRALGRILPVIALRYAD